MDSCYTVTGFGTYLFVKISEIFERSGWLGKAVLADDMSFAITTEFGPRYEDKPNQGAFIDAVKDALLSGEEVCIFTRDWLPSMTSIAVTHLSQTIDEDTAIRVVKE